MNDAESPDRLRWETITTESEWEDLARVWRALERVALATWADDATAAELEERVIGF